MDWKIISASGPLHGEITVPPDKSVSHRAVMFAAICAGKTRVENFLFAEDCMRTFDAFRKMGCRIERHGDDVIVEGEGLNGLREPSEDLYLGNSGTTMRVIAGIIAGAGLSATLSGDPSLSKRPMERIVSPLRKMGAVISTLNGDRPPLKIGRNARPLEAIDYVTPVASAQVKSCILAAGLYARGKTSVTEPFRSRDHTERMLRHFSAGIEATGLTTKITGMRELVASDIRIPGDISSAAFFIVAASIVEGSEIVLRNAGLNPTRTGVIDVMRRMGADITITDRREGMEPEGDLKIKYSELKGTVIPAAEIPLLIDEVPILAVAAACARGVTVIEGVGELKVKESDRVKCMAENLDRMGHEIFEEKGALVIPGRSGKLHSGDFDSYGDHRIAMSMAVAALIGQGESRVRNVACVDTSYPAFVSHLEKLRA
jgi:3-phosphoshikimate 1-carboxyvinyltransferase